MTTVLITGVSGFIGSHIAKKFLDMDFQVIAPIRPQSMWKVDELKKNGNFKAISGDFYDRTVLGQINQGIDAVLHFASIRGEGSDKKLYHRINIEGTRDILEFTRSAKIPRFIYCSSVGVLGTIPRNQPAVAGDDGVPDNLYHNSKWQSEQLVNTYHNAQLNTCILRPTISYGLGDDGFIPRLIDLVRSNRFLLTSREVYIHLLDVHAFAVLVFNIINSALINGKTYIVADRSPVLLKEVVDLVTLNSGKGAGYFKVPAFALDAGETLLKMLGQKRLHTSIQLINRNWMYKIDETVKDFSYQASDTITELKKYLEEINKN